MDFKINSDSRYYFFASLIGIGNALFSGNRALSVAFTVVQIAIVFLYLFSNDVNRSICYMFICVAMGLTAEATNYSMEGLWYGLKMFKFLGVNLGVWIQVPFVIICLLKFNAWGKFIRISSTDDTFDKALKLLLFINISSILLGFFNVYILNDNDVLSLNNLTYYFFGDVYLRLFGVFFPFMILYWRLKVDQRFYSCLVSSIKGMIIAVIISCIVSVISGHWSIRVDAKLLWVSLIGYYLPCIIIFPFYSNIANKKRWFMVGAISVAFGFLFFLSSKSFILLLLEGIVSLGLIIRKENLKNTMKIFLLIVAGLFILLLIGYDFEVKGMMQWKLSQVLELLNIFRDNWWELLPRSPKWRLIELIDIFKEYSNKPYMALFGKGIMGTIKDYSGYLIANWSANGASVDALNSGLFYSMHESVNTLLLSNGLLGLYSIIWMLKKLWVNKCSCFLLIGVCWYICYFGYSYTLSIFGVMCLACGLFEYTLNETGNDESYLLFPSR